MKKRLLIGMLSLLVIGIGSAFCYWFFIHEPPRPERPKRDPNLWTVPPIAYSMKGKTFVVPDQPETKVDLTLVAPGTKYDYPMGRFILATGTGEGTLYVLDEFATTLEGNKRAVPMAVSTGGTGTFFYLAIIEETENSFNHVNSVLLGDRIKINKVNRNGNEVSVEYYVHDRGQQFTDYPSVLTTAIIDINSNIFIQEGRKPWLEEILVAKEFKGKYWWQKTESPDGSSATPSKPETFGLIFDGNQVSLMTDCNSGSSVITLPKGTSSVMSFGGVSATKMFCQSSEERPYFDMIESVVSYLEKDKTIIFNLKDDRIMEFIKAEEKLEFENSSLEASSTEE